MKVIFLWLGTAQKPSDDICKVGASKTDNVSKGHVSLNVSCKRHSTAAGYVEMLQWAPFMTDGPRLGGDKWVFHQDIVAVINALLTKDFFRRIASLFWTTLHAPWYKSN